MTTPQTRVPAAKMSRLLYASMIAGVLLFALVAHFVMRPAAVGPGLFPPAVAQSLLGVALALCALSFVLRRRVPRRSNDESADLYWTRAQTNALTTWAVAQAAGLISVLVYSQTGSASAVGVGAIALACYFLHTPTSLERR
jgi:hypothetical protein